MNPFRSPTPLAAYGPDSDESNPTWYGVPVAWPDPEALPAVAAPEVLEELLPEAVLLELLHAARARAKLTPTPATATFVDFTSFSYVLAG
jgi:hypothetical protein